MLTEQEKLINTTVCELIVTLQELRSAGISEELRKPFLRAEESLFRIRQTILDKEED